MKTCVIAVVLVAFALLSARPAWAQHASLFDDRPKINVTGEALVNVKPDKILVSLGIETVDKDISAAKQKNGDLLKRTLAAVKECGVAEKDVQTDHLSIEPRYRDYYSQDNFLGYFVRNSIVVTLTRPDKVEELITKALRAGVNHIHGIDFQNTEFKKHREQARELALRAAKEKAEKMAAALGQKIGSPLQISENYGGSPWGYYSSWSGSGWGHGRNMAMTQNAVQNIGGPSGESPESIAMGMIGIRANVSVTFELKK